MIVLVTGAAGQLGQDLVRVLESGNGHVIYPTTRETMDVTDDNAVRKAIFRARPDAVIHAAAYTNVDGAEDTPDQAYLVNVVGTRNVAAAAAETGAKLIYVSTDYVFDGKKGAPYDEMDTPSPLSVYGKSKLFGEKAVESLHNRYFILRTSWLFGRNGKNFVTKILRLARENGQLSAVTDQTGSPTYTLDLARFIERIMVTDKYGTYHVSNKGNCSRYEFAGKILKISGMTKVDLMAVSSGHFPLPAKRPENSSFDHLFIRLNGFPEMRSWETALSDFISNDLQKGDVQ